MKPRWANRWRLALLFGVALMGRPQLSHPAPNDPPVGFVWEEMQAVGARLLRAKGSFYKSNIGPGQAEYIFSRQPFEKPKGVEDGLLIIVNSAAGPGESADKVAAASLARCAAEGTVLRGNTKRGEPSEPFTTSTLVYTYRRQLDGAAYTAKMVCVANRATNTLYVLVLQSHTANWEEIEAWGEPMLASLRLDPKM